MLKISFLYFSPPLLQPQPERAPHAAYVALPHTLFSTQSHLIPNPHFFQSMNQQCLFVTSTTPLFLIGIQK